MTLKILKWIAAQIEWLKSFLQENNGKASMKRLIQLLIAATFLRAFFKDAELNGVINDIPENWMILLMGTIGLGIVANYFDKKDPNVQRKSIGEKFKDLISKKEEATDQQ